MNRKVALFSCLTGLLILSASFLGVAFAKQVGAAHVNYWADNDQFDLINDGTVLIAEFRLSISGDAAFILTASADPGWTVMLGIRDAYFTALGKAFIVKGEVGTFFVDISGLNGFTAQWSALDIRGNTVASGTFTYTPPMEPPK
jgi:hypothetical protein